MTSPLERVLERLPEARKTQYGTYLARCPAHDDRTPSLSVTEVRNGTVLLKCFGGCKTEAVVQAIGLEMRDLFPDAQPHVNGSAPQAQTAKTVQSAQKVQEAVYPYRDKDGTLVCEVVRFRKADGGKTFQQRRPDGRGGYIWDMQDVQRVLYRLPSLLHAGTEEWVFVCEGEKDTDNLIALGLHATTCIGGAGKWRDEYSEDLQAARVCILPDNDKPGRDHAQQVAASLYGRAREVRMLDLAMYWAEMPDKGDVSDYLAAGGTSEALVALADAAPVYVLQDAAAPAVEAHRASVEAQTDSAADVQDSAADAYADIPADVRAQWLEEWRAAAATGCGRFYGAQAFLDTFLRSAERKSSDPIPGVLPEGETMVLVGATGSGKTTTLVNLAVQKGAGKDLFGVWECEAGAVLYCATEDLYGVAERFASALAQEGASAASARLHFHDKLPALVQPSAFGQKSAGGWEFFQSVRAEQYRGNLPETLALVLLDYLRNATEGASENSNDDMGLALDAANRVAKALKTGVILAAHTGKADDEDVRGAQIIKDKAYCIAVLKGRAEVDAVKPVELFFTKNPKSAERPESIQLQLTHAPNGGVYMMPVATPSDVTARASILRALEVNPQPLLQKELMSATGLKGNTLDVTLRRMCEAKDIERIGKQKPYSYRRISEGIRTDFRTE